MRKVLLACFGDTRDIERSLACSESVEVLACPAGVDDLFRLDPVYDAILVSPDNPVPFEIGGLIDWVNINLAHRLKGGSRPVWL